VVHYQINSCGFFHSAAREHLPFFKEGKERETHLPQKSNWEDDGVVSSRWVDGMKNGRKSPHDASGLKTQKGGRK
jgi:hypothetical protein